MKKLLLLALVFVSTTALAQKKSDTTYIDGTQELPFDGSFEKRQLQIQVQTLQSLNDSLAAKINQMLIFHYYACQIIQEIYSDGKIRSKVNFIEAVKQYHDHYKKILK